MSYRVWVCVDVDGTAREAEAVRGAMEEAAGKLDAELQESGVHNNDEEVES
jgi:hypothetical protein